MVAQGQIWRGKNTPIQIIIQELLRKGNCELRSPQTKEVLYNTGLYLPFPRWVTYLLNERWAPLSLAFLAKFTVC